MPGGHPSTTQPMAGPWDSPKVVTVKRVPRVLPDMRRCGAEMRSVECSTRGAAPSPLSASRRASPATRACSASGVACAGASAGATSRRDPREDAAPERPRHRRAAVPAEEAAVEPLERHRHDGHRRALDDARDPGPERADLAVLGDPPLGEDAHELALREGRGHLVVGAARGAPRPPSPARSGSPSRCGTRTTAPGSGRCGGPSRSGSAAGSPPGSPARPRSSRGCRRSPPRPPPGCSRCPPCAGGRPSGRAASTGSASGTRAPAGRCRRPRPRS